MHFVQKMKMHHIACCNVSTDCHLSLGFEVESVSSASRGKTGHVSKKRHVRYSL